MPLLAVHREELTTNKQLMVLKPDWERYRVLEESGALFTLIAKDGDELIGYSCNLISTNLHYADLVYVHNDLLFLRADHRGTTGLRLIRETEDEARRRGARLIVWHAKPGTVLDKLLLRRGYRVQDVLYMKEL